MADVKWIKLSTDLFNNRKIKQLRKMPEGDAVIGVWMQILCLAGNINNGGLVYFSQDIPYTDEMLAAEFDRPMNIIRLSLSVFEQFNMVHLEDNVLCVSNWEKYQSAETLKKIREQTRKRVQKHREKQKLLCNVTRNATVTHGNDTELELELDKTYSAFFEEIWALYPNKKGKGQVSNAKKKYLYKIGLEEITRAINRYLQDLKKDDWRKPQNGSTFFNSGHVDYLDANYEDKPTQTAKPVQPSEIPEGWL